MNKEEFLQQEENDFNNLDLDNAIRLVKLYNKTGRDYFHNWQECEKEIEKLKFQIWQLKEKLAENFS